MRNYLKKKNKKREIPALPWKRERHYHVSITLTADCFDAGSDQKGLSPRHFVAVQVHTDLCSDAA